MGAGYRTDFAAPDGLPGSPLSRDDGGAAGTSSHAPPAVPPPVLLPGMAAVLRDIRFDFGHQFAVAADVTADLRERWTGARADGLGHFTAGSHTALLDWMHAEMEQMPVSREFSGADRLLTRCMARHPGWAVVYLGDAFAAWQGDSGCRAGSLVELETLMDAAASA